jgi:hypothetical protein
MTAKAKRTAPRKTRKPEPARQTLSNRAARLAILEQQERQRARPVFPEPESDECYRP